MKPEDDTLIGYLNVLASKDPVPGGGSTGAMCVAQGMAVVVMATELTIGLDDYSEFEDDCRAVNRKLSEYCNKVMTLMIADTTAYKNVIEACGSGNETAMERALKSACDIPYMIIAFALKGLKEAAKIKDRYNPGCRVDYTAGVINMAAGAKIARMNLKVNLDEIGNEKLMKRFAEADSMMREIEELEERLC